MKFAVLHNNWGSQWNNLYNDLTLKYSWISNRAATLCRWLLSRIKKLGHTWTLCNIKKTPHYSLRKKNFLCIDSTGKQKSMLQQRNWNRTIFQQFENLNYMYPKIVKTDLTKKIQSMYLFFLCTVCEQQDAITCIG